MTKNEFLSLWFSQKRLKPGLCLVQSRRGKNERSCVRAQRAWEQGTDTVQGLTRVEARKVGLSKL